MEEFRPEGPGRIWSHIRARWERARRRRRLVKGKKEAPFVMAKAALPVLSLDPLLAMLLSTPILSMTTPGRWARNRNKTSRRLRLQARWPTLIPSSFPSLPLQLISSIVQKPVQRRLENKRPPGYSFPFSISRTACNFLSPRQKRPPAEEWTLFPSPTYLSVVFGKATVWYDHPAGASHRVTRDNSM